MCQMWLILLVDLRIPAAPNSSRASTIIYMHVCTQEYIYIYVYIYIHTHILSLCFSTTKYTRFCITYTQIGKAIEPVQSVASASVAASLLLLTHTLPVPWKPVEHSHLDVVRLHRELDEHTLYCLLCIYIISMCMNKKILFAFLCFESVRTWFNT
jgi:hypothetical protein